MARRDAFIDHLQEVALFSACSRKDLQLVARRAEDVRVPAGKVLVTEGETGHEFFVILEGTAKVTRQGRRIATLGPGQAFGELALLDKAPRNATVVAESDMELVVLGQREFAGHHRRGPRLRRASCSPAWPSASASPTPSPCSKLAPTACYVRRSPRRCRAASSSQASTRMRRLGSSPVLVLVVGVLVMLGAFFSGIFPRITEWHDDSPVAREVFVNIPDPLYWAFYATVPVMLFMVAYLASLRFRNYERGAPDDRRTTKKNASAASRDFRRGVWMQTLLRDPAAGIMHSCIYFGFIFLFIATVMLEIDHQLPESMKFLHGRTYQAYAFGADLAGVIFLVGIGWAIGAPLHPAPVPHPHQDQARRRRDPRHVRDHRRHRVPRRSGPHRADRGPARLREVVVRRLSALGARRHVVAEHAAATRTAGCGSCTSSRSSRSS